MKYIAEIILLIMKYIAEIILIFMWVAGTVLSKGVLSTFFCIVFPPWAWYIFIEKVLIMQGFM
jgi:hypothetical protein